jgi:hypothetical protein
MVTVPRDHIFMLMLGEYFSEKHATQDKIAFFQNKYNMDFHEFNKKIFNESENFELYDDFIEWKAYTDYLVDIKKKINDVKNGNLQIA